MHELSVISQLIDVVISEAQKNNMEKVEEVLVEVGDFTALSQEQLIFAYETLTQNNRGVLAGSRLVIHKKPGRVECSACAYSGGIEYEQDARYHFTYPKLYCPECNAPVNLVEGRECIVKSIKGTLNSKVQGNV
jgi:hydrogenase nickel incorporation protein HypA/HybF